MKAAGYSFKMKITRRDLFLSLVIIALHGISCLAQADPAGDFAALCDTLKDADFSGLQDAPTKITEVHWMKADGATPAFCRVQGYVAPQVGFEIRLPAPNWNGKFLLLGCGGLCGVLYGSACGAGLRKGYACLVSDMGHSGADALWAYNNLQAKVDFAFRATHVAAIAGKAITERYYRVLPNKSYLMGCSAGGRQGLVAAQRFPWDFDGIVAGAPATSRVAQAAVHAAVIAAHRQREEPTLTPSAVQLLHAAVVKQCDLDDGVSDGIIEYPPACKFDAHELLCESDQKDCLTEPQVKAAKKIYAGTTAPSGEKLARGPAVGSELEWVPYIVTPGPDAASTGMTKHIEGILRYLSFMPDPGPTWRLDEFDVGKDYRRLGIMSALLSASNPDLRPFKAAGGKLIAYAGWNDPLVAPEQIIDYYETVERTMGGRKTTQDFFRLFMLPGVGHCAGGAGADEVDYLAALEAWVEHGHAPDRLIAARLKDRNAQAPDFPLDDGAVQFTRPVYPYPIHARYSGKGDPNSASSFKPSTTESPKSR